MHDWKNLATWKLFAREVILYMGSDKPGITLGYEPLKMASQTKLGGVRRLNSKK
jgi:hypothetical protein